ncbi:hypothetical protein R1sor_027315 [Riccia sorocarpa]|uniref:ABC transporter domain-containing protein n=1 Tax=Riccia sorocarpa TaxID=122646 RepID=A0ABD3GFK6_9MARC
MVLLVAREFLDLAVTCRGPNVRQNKSVRTENGEVSFIKVKRSGISSICPERIRCPKFPTNFNCKYSPVLCVVLPERTVSVGETDFLQVKGVTYRPPGSEAKLLDNVSFSLPEKSLGLVYGASGSGKTTLLQIFEFRHYGSASVSPLRVRYSEVWPTPTNGAVYVGSGQSDSTKTPSSPTSLSARVGIVFQFPERCFLTDTIVEELMFGWSRQTQDPVLRQTLTLRIQSAVYVVGLQGMPLDMNPRNLSDGYKRRLALAVQLVRMPDVMLLDEPLAGLDWKARADVVKLLTTLKKEKTVIVVSHDLKELSPLVDRAWQMEMGGILTKQPWPSAVTK